MTNPIYSETYSLYDFNGATILSKVSKEKAFEEAERLCGNSCYSHPFEGCYLFGSGDGYTTHIIRRDFKKSI